MKSGRLILANETFIHTSIFFFIELFYKLGKCPLIGVTADRVKRTILQNVTSKIKLFCYISTIFEQFLGWFRTPVKEAATIRKNCEDTFFGLQKTVN